MVLSTALLLLCATLTGCVCFSLHLISPRHPAKRMLAEFKCRVTRIQENYLDELDRIHCCDLATINQTMAEGDKLLDLMDRIKQDIGAEQNRTAKELQGYYHALLISSQLHVYSEPERDMFETSEAFQQRSTKFEKKLADANQTSVLAENWVQKEQKEKNLELSIEAAQWRIKMLKPFVRCLTDLQEQVFLMPELPVEVDLQKPDPDKSRFPMGIKAHGLQWTRFWAYGGESAGWTFWKTRSQIKARAYVQMAPHNNTASWTPTAVDIWNPVTEQERHFHLGAPAVFGAVASFQQEQKNAVANLKFQHREDQVKIGFTEPITGMQFVWAPSGCFEMGCGAWDKNCAANELPAHKVCLSNFLISRYEVTQKQWEKIMGGNPSHFKKGPDYPIDNATWADAQQFIAALNAMSPDAHFFRLPTEAEWEYACRSGGKNELYAGGGAVQDAAWYKDTSSKSTHPVGKKQHNGLGASDMSGNVGEWVQDDYDSLFYTNRTEQNPVCKAGGAGLKAIRGGSWNSLAEDVRCTARGFYFSAKRGNMVGFRLVMELKQ
jgi:formylglycine-generating enzyme required for sulfatase activity